jgi:hypothetical protein
MILLNTLLRDRNECEILAGRSLGFNTSPEKLCTFPASLNWSTFIDDGRVTIAIFLDVANAFLTLWIKALLYEFTVLKIPDLHGKNHIFTP